MDEISKFFNKPNFWEQFDENDLTSSTIMNYFREKTIFLTGATGFLGQLYMEKLLRCGVKRIYILARTKKNKTAEERLVEMFSGIQFYLLKKYCPDFIKRITIVEGDLAELGVAIQERSLKLLRENVQIIIHAGADVRFQEKLIRLLLVNLRGTRELLRLAETFEKLEVFTYISTAYSNSPKGYNIYEKFYPYPIDPETMIALAERLGKNEAEFNRFEELTDSILRPWPNTYSYTKSLSEEMVRRFGEKFPIAVLRPSIVISTYREPIPAWSNSLSGFNGAVVGRGMGVLRTSYAVRNVVLDLVCADFVINSTLAVIWVTSMDALRNRRLEIPTTAKIYNIGSSKDHPMRCDKTTDELAKYYKEEPSNSSLWKPCYGYSTCPVMLKYRSILYHFLSTVLFDLFLKLRGNKLRLLPHYRKMQMFVLTLNYFVGNEWKFDNTNLRSVIDRMSPLDRKLFDFDLRIFDFEGWAPLYVQGLKKYSFGDKLDAETKKEAVKRQKRLEKMHYLALLMYYSISSSIVYGAAKGLGLINYFENLLS